MTWPFWATLALTFWILVSAHVAYAEDARHLRRLARRTRERLAARPRLASGVEIDGDAAGGDVAVGRADPAGDAGPP